MNLALFKMIHDHTSIIHYKKQNQQVHIPICTFIISKLIFK